jgi:uncharacterized protein with HEPN domain
LPFRDPVDGLRDIRDAIDMIERFTEGMDFEAFREDPKTVAAVERKLLVISEAAIRLGEQGPVKARRETPPDMPHLPSEYRSALLPFNTPLPDSLEASCQCLKIR